MASKATSSSGVAAGEPETFSVHSNCNRDLAFFFIFVGVVCSVPLGELFAKLVLRIPDLDWRISVSLGLVVVVYALFLMKLTRSVFSVQRNAQGGFVEVKEGFFSKPVRYFFEGKPLIRLQSVEDETCSNNRCEWQVTLIVGKCYYLLDKRVNRLMESRGLAEFLSKSIACPLLLHIDSNTVEIEHTDLDLPLSARVKKYPALIGPKLEAKQVSGIKVKDVDGNTGRVYTWGALGSGVLVNSVGFMMAIVVFGFLPVFGELDNHCSLIEIAKASGHYEYFFGILLLFAVIVGIQSGYQGQIAVRGEAVIAKITLWGISLWERMIPINSLEEINTRALTSGASLILVSDDLIATVRLGGIDMANYVQSDITEYISQRA